MTKPVACAGCVQTIADGSMALRVEWGTVCDGVFVEREPDNQECRYYHEDCANHIWPEK